MFQKYQEISYVSYIPASLHHTLAHTTTQRSLFNHLALVEHAVVIGIQGVSIILVTYIQFTSQTSYSNSRNAVCVFVG